MLSRIVATSCAVMMAMLPINSAQTVESTTYWMKLKAKDKFERSVIADTGVSINKIIDEYVYATGTLEEMNQLEKLGFVETSFALTADMLDFPTEDSKYHNYAEMTAALKKIADENPDITQMSSIGKSVEGRDIWAIRISGNLSQASTLPGVIFMGGHHAREHLSVEVPLKLAQYLVAQYRNNDARISSLLEYRDIHIIPAVNPDGLEWDISTGKYKLWRKNRAKNSNGTFGVDLNRNYGFQWGTGGSSKNPNSDTFMGPTPFSEPETKAIKAYVEANNNLSTLLSFHTFSKLILYPWGHKYEGIENTRDKAVHEKMAQKMAQWNDYQPQQSSELYIASGDTTDWSYGQLKMISFTFELDPANGGSSMGFYPGDEIIDEVFQKNINPALLLMDYADNPYRILESGPF